MAAAGARAKKKLTKNVNTSLVSNRHTGGSGKSRLHARYNIRAYFSDGSARIADNITIKAGAETLTNEKADNRDAHATTLSIECHLTASA